MHLLVGTCKWLQALASCPAVLEYLNRSLEAQPEVEAPLANAVSDCLARTSPHQSDRRKCTNPKEVLKAFR